MLIYDSLKKSTMLDDLFECARSSFERPYHRLTVSDVGWALFDYHSINIDEPQGSHAAWPCRITDIRTESFVREKKNRPATVGKAWSLDEEQLLVSRMTTQMATINPDTGKLVRHMS